MKKTMYILATALAVLTSCGDSLEDTYKDFAGDGPIRYTGKCTNISVNPGWECLRTTWTPSKDPAVKNIRITWISENSDTATAEVAPTDTAYTIKGLNNQNYQVMVQSVAENGTPSLADKITRRPYTYEHEAVTAFTQGFNKYYLYHNHLLLFMGNWTDGILHFARWKRQTGTPSHSRTPAYEPAALLQYASAPVSIPYPGQTTAGSRRFSSEALRYDSACLNDC